MAEITIPPPLGEKLEIDGNLSVVWTNWFNSIVSSFSSLQTQIQALLSPKDDFSIMKRLEILETMVYGQTQEKLSSPSKHGSTHIKSGSDEVDGDQLDIDWNPSNYTPDTTPTQVSSVDHLTAHLYGIDQRVATTTTTTRGTIELATNAECKTGTDTQRAVTPDGLVAAVKEQSTGAANDIYGGTAVEAEATGGGDTFVLTIIASNTYTVGLEIDLVGRYVNQASGFYKKFLVYAGMGTGVVYDASTTEHLAIGDAVRADLTAGNPVAVGGQLRFTVTFTNANANSFSGYIRVVSYSNGAISYTVANNQ